MKAQAQNDSIYGLEIEKHNQVINLSFYSTYNIDNLASIDFVFYDAATGQEIGAKPVYYRQGVLYSKFGEVAITPVSANVYRITLTNGKLYTHTETNQQMEVYLQGYAYGAPSALRSAKAETPKTPQKSNVLSITLE
jgi:hypothetical protein